MCHFRVKLGQFLGRALRLGQSSGPSAEDRTDLRFQKKYIFRVRFRDFRGRALQVEQERRPSAAAMTGYWGPNAAVRKGEGAGHCGHMTTSSLCYKLYACTKLIGGWGRTGGGRGPKIVL